MAKKSIVIEKTEQEIAVVRMYSNASITLADSSMLTLILMEKWKRSQQLLKNTSQIGYKKPPAKYKGMASLVSSIS